MQNYFFSIREAAQDFCLRLVSMPYLDDAAACLSCLDYEYAPTGRFAKCGADGYLENVACSPSHDSGSYPVTVSQSIGRIDEVCNHVDALLFHSQRRYFGKSRGLHQAHARMQRMIATPPFQLDR